MILRIDRIQTEMPPPSDPDPDGAAAVQELMGGRFGEMSTLMNYTFQSFNFRNRQGARPFYDLIANIAAEEYGHIELVSVAINTMLTGATPPANGRPPGDALKDLRDEAINPHHFIAGGQGTLPQDSRGAPWTGDYVFSSGDLVEDLTHNFFLETGARNNKLKVYEMVDHPAARALTGYLLVRGGVHQVAYARAVEKLTGADLMKMFPSPRGGGGPGGRPPRAGGRPAGRSAAGDRRVRPGLRAGGDRADRREAPPGRRAAEGADGHRGQQRPGPRR